MPGKIKVKILAGRNLPVMDKSGDTTDGYVEIKFGCITYKTDVCRKTLNPQWNSEWYRFEVDDAELQDEPLQIRLMDHDTYSANDAIGKVYINLNPLLLPGLPLTVKNIWTLEATINSSTGSQGGSVMAGWIPVFDTMHGIRGEVNIIVKVELFSDFNKFKQSSCGVQFFYSPNVPHGYHAQVIHGFVEELIVSDDPEYKWIDKIRTPRASNEARQTLFLKLSGEVQRKIGLKALDLGGNAVIGYIQTFDLEGESGIVARGIGTAVTLVKLHDVYNLPLDNANVEDLACFSLQNKNQFECSESDDSVPLLSHSPSHSPISSRSPIRIHKTRVGNKFPIYEKSLKNSYATARISEINASTMKSRIGSLQNSPMGSFKKGSSIGSGSSLSLSDDLMCESSLRSMLALEDMRGERTSAFSRGLKNLRYLPKRVIQMKSKFSESFDDESDQDSNYSSSWSIVGGSDSTRSSISDFRQSIRRKKFTHRRNTSDSSGGIAALLIRSVHTGFPLDSVTEDRETPTPSPVQFLGNRHTSVEHPVMPLKCITETNSNEISGQNGICKIVTIEKNEEDLETNAEKPFDYNDKTNIPMISSSESDTSTSDDEPSESSTNYNILDDSFSVIDSTSPEDIKICGDDLMKAIDSNKTFDEKGNTDFVRSETPIQGASTNDNVATDIYDDGSLNLTESKSFGNHENSLPEGLILDAVVSQEEIFTPRIPSVPSTPDEGFIDPEYSMPSSLPTSPLRTTPSFKLKILGKQEGFDNEDIIFPDATSTPLGERKNFFVTSIDSESVSSRNESPSLVEPYMECLVSVSNDQSLKEHTFDQQKNFVSVNHSDQYTKISTGMTDQIVLPLEKLRKSDQSTKVKHERKISDSTSSPLPYKKYLIDRGSLEGKNSAEKREKTAKKVMRTDTVIYKGPVKEKEKSCASINHKDMVGKIAKENCSSTAINTPTIVIAPPPQPDCYLRVPTADPISMNVHTPCPPEDSNSPVHPAVIEQPNHVLNTETQLTDDRIVHKYRQHCMFDLIKTIDARMMIHASHNERKDSTKSKRKHREHGNINTTPSPDSIRKSRLHRKDSRSKSPPEKHHHRHHHHHHHHHSSNHSHQLSPLAISNSNSGAHLPNTLTYPLLKLLRETDVSSCDSSSENLPRNNTNITMNDSAQVVTCTKKSAIDCNNPNCKLNNCDNGIGETNHELAANKLSLKCLNDEKMNDDSCSIKMNTVKILSKPNNFGLLLNPNEIDPSVHKSHSEGSLGKLNNNHPPLTYIPNNANNVIDNPCVPCFPITLRQQEDQEKQQQQQSTSPSHPVSSSGLTASGGSKAVNSPATKTPLHRRSSDSDLSITPKGNSLAGSDRSMAGQLRPSTAIRTMNQDALEMLEYPFITIQQYPPGFILNLGGLVSARSVKLIEKLNNLEEPEGRDAWWTEIRMEVRSHARALGCNVILGYREEISICDDVCVLNASGTAAVINLLNPSQEQDISNRNAPAAVVSSIESEKGQQKSAVNKSERDDCQIISPPPPLQTQQQQINPSMGKITRISECSNDTEMPMVTLQNSCNYCHLPYSETSVPFKVDVSKCGVCRRAKVPDVLFTTIELPDNIPITGRGVFLQATVCKCKRDLRGELNAKEISDCLPFLEYELHSLLLNKLKVKGMNAIFGLKVQISIGERLIVGMAVGTAVFLTALPTPLIPKIASGNSWHNDEQLAEIQRALIETVKRNRELYYLKSTTPGGEVENGRAVTAPQASDTDESDDDLPDLDLGVGTKDACVLEVDDVEDMDRINLLMDETTPDDFHVVNTQIIPGLRDLEIVRNLQMFTQVSRAKIPSGQYASMPSKYFARMLQTVFFKLRRMVPCALCDMQFKVALTDQDEIQLSVVGMALGLGEPTKLKNKYKRNNNKGIINNAVNRDLLKKFDDNHLIFKLDEDQAENVLIAETTNNQQTPQQLPTGINPLPVVCQIQKPNRPRSPLKPKARVQLQRHKHVPLKERYGVDITPLSYLPGGRIERYLGNLNFFFIRECTSIRENGGLSGFTHSFITEVLAICRAHITALGGNAMVAFFMTQCELVHSPHKNQGQCLINVGGDVVSVSYFGGERVNQNC